MSRGVVGISVWLAGPMDRVDGAKGLAIASAFGRSGGVSEAEGAD